LSAGFIRPKTETRPTGKERTVIAAAIAALQRDRAPDADDARLKTQVLPRDRVECPSLQAWG
jgi:hypothetical protein